MKILKSPQDVLNWRRSLSTDSTKSPTVGFVPTMGALHSGHEALLAKARAENNYSVLSIFVNPTQFNDKQDFEKYPVTWETDLQIAQRNNVDIVWSPNFEMMYPDQYRFKIMENEFSSRLCGRDRPGHFDGVLTVVMKLLNIVQPTKAYFGEKDYQQLSLVKEMVESFFLPYEIVPVATVREASGLAMSSRNVRLTPAQKELAPLIYSYLKNSGSAEEAKNKLQSNNLQVDYVEDFQGRRYAAVRVGEVRLIDNIQI
jgi:pantoate--beta-alanine ligase